jgi:hypothetical protein
MKSGIEKLQQELETQQVLFQRTEESMRKDLEATTNMYSDTKNKLDQVQVCMLVYAHYAYLCAYVMTHA